MNTNTMDKQGIKGRSMKVCMFVYNNFTHDARVFKEAKTLVSNGYEVKVIALHYPEDLPENESIQGIEVIRIPRNPIHFRLFIRKPKQTLLKNNKPTTNLLVGSNTLENETDKRTNGLGDKNPKHNVLPTGDSQVSPDSIQVNKHTKNIVVLGKKVGKSLPKKAFVFTKKILKSIRKKILRAKKNILMAEKKLFKVFFSLVPYTLHKYLCFLDFHLQCFKLAALSGADIYHAHDLNVLGIAFHASKSYGGSIVYDSHEFYVERNRAKKLHSLGKFLLTQYEKFLVRKADLVITVSESIAKEFEKRYQIPKPKVILNAPNLLNRNCLDSDLRDQCSIRKLLNISSDQKLVLYCGSITFNRGLEKVIESLHYFPEGHLVMMGYGKEAYLQKLSHVAEQTNVRDRVTFLEAVPSEQVTTYASSADVGIAPIENVCLSYYYCSPNKIFEYVNAGIPVVASNFPEMRKVVDKYNIGAVFNPEDPLDIANTLRFIFSDLTSYEAMKRNTEAAAAEYNWEREADKLLALYDELFEPTTYQV